jgi:hypothetical protein
MKSLQEHLPIMVGVSGRCALSHAARHADTIGLTMLGRTLADGQRHETRWELDRLDRTVAFINDEMTGRSQPVEPHAPPDRRRSRPSRRLRRFPRLPGVLLLLTASIPLHRSLPAGRQPLLATSYQLIRDRPLWLLRGQRIDRLQHREQFTGQSRHIPARSLVEFPDQAVPDGLEGPSRISRPDLVHKPAGIADRLHHGSHCGIPSHKPPIH